MGEAATENSRLRKPQLPREFPQFLVIVLDQLASRFAVHSAEPVTDRPHPAANAIARFEHRDPASTPVELARRRKPRQPRPDDDHSHGGHASS